MKNFSMFKYTGNDQISKSTKKFFKSFGYFYQDLNFL